MPEDAPASRGDLLAERFTVAVNRNGHAFHHRVIHEVQQLDKAGATRFHEHAFEFPVTVQNRDTSIDLILKSHDDANSPEFDVYLTCECKKANPALKDWCFCRASAVCRNADPETKLSVEYVRMKSPIQWVKGSGIKLQRIDDQAVRLGIEIKGNEKGDPKSKGRGGIEEALTQCCLGVSGLVEHFRENAGALGQYEAVIIPVVFTTAHLWVSRVSLAETDILTGEVTKSELDEVPWVIYQYHVSRGIKHSASSIVNARDLPGILESEYVRSVVIVNAAGIADFLWNFRIYEENVRDALR